MGHWSEIMRHWRKSTGRKSGIMKAKVGLWVTRVRIWGSCVELWRDKRDDGLQKQDDGRTGWDDGSNMGLLPTWTPSARAERCQPQLSPLQGALHQDLAEQEVIWGERTGMGGGKGGYGALESECGSLE